MKVALVYDRVNKYGGAERVVKAIHELYPQAPLFTPVYNRGKATWCSNYPIITSFLQKTFIAPRLHELFPTINPLAIESFDFDKYDLVISITSCDGKGIITKPSTCHICYCLTPTRYLWSAYLDYQNEPGFNIANPLVNLCHKLFSRSLRQWDYIASSRPDAYIAISKTVADRINKYYHKGCAVVYPPVETEIFHYKRNESRNNYFLIVSRLVPYKKIDYVISAFNKLKYKLIIIGTGIDKDRLKKQAKNNIQFIDTYLTDQKLCWYYENCLALIYPNEEDFGITSVEAQACGKPVIALGRGGVAETVIPGITGELYDSCTSEDLMPAIIKISRKRYSPQLCRENALRFSIKIFKKKFKQEVKKILNTQSHKPI